jgi:hypothetical protein
MIFIDRGLRSSKPSVRPGQTAILSLDLSSSQSSETAQIEYEILTPGVTFSTGSRTLTHREEVFSTGTTPETPYALDGSSGAVEIRATVTPSVPPALSATVVALLSAGIAVASASRKAVAGRKVARKTKAERKAKVTKKTKAVRKAKVARKTETARKTAARKTAKKKVTRRAGRASKRR